MTKQADRKRTETAAALWKRIMELADDRKALQEENARLREENGYLRASMDILTGDDGEDALAPAEAPPEPEAAMTREEFLEALKGGGRLWKLCCGGLGLTEARAAFPGMPRADMDAMLLSLHGAGRLYLSVSGFGRGLTEEQARDAVDFNGCPACRIQM
jgi:hypothetical protein